MEEKSRGNLILQSEPAQEELHKNISVQGTASQKSSKRFKKDLPKQKKRLKIVDKKQPPSAQLQTESAGLKQKEEEDRSVESIESSLKDTPKTESNTGSPNCSFSKLMIGPPYINSVQGNIIQGNHGHASTLLKRPIVEGNYFMEFIVKNDAKHDKFTTFPSAVRVGICSTFFDVDYPLGCTESIGYKGKDGSIVYQNQCVGNSEPFQIGDILGVCMRIAPPKKSPKPEEILQGSLVEFYKNGQLMFTFSKLKQVFYCFAISTYNYSQVEFSLKKDGHFKYPQAKHYLEALNEKIPYKELVTNKMFKI